MWQKSTSPNKARFFMRPSSVDLHRFGFTTLYSSVNMLFPLWYLQREEKRKKQIKNAFKGSFKVLAIYFVHPRKRKEPFP